jgi:hypothetical protein
MSVSSSPTENAMPDATVCAAGRTTAGRCNDRRFGWHPSDLAGSRIADGGSGVLVVARVHALHAHGDRYGLQTMYEGRGMAKAMLVARL